MSDEANQEVRLQTLGPVGHIELNRPKALNALSLGMLKSISEALAQWRDDPQVEMVVISGVGDRAFCSGSDVKAIAKELQAARHFVPGKPGSLAADFFRAEYTLDYVIANYPKPFITYMDGITMGGGAGVAVHGSHRIATERTTFAMPETGIGFFPDAGATHFLSRLGAIGKLLAMSGLVIDGFATVELGLATHFADSGGIERLLSCLAERGLEAGLDSFCKQAPKSERLPSLQALAEDCFIAADLRFVLSRLREVSDGSLIAKELHQLINGRSPTSLWLANKSQELGKELSLRECLTLEYRICQACMAAPDFCEGVRAVLVDKDQEPKWSPAAADLLDSRALAKYFESLGSWDLSLPE